MVTDILQRGAKDNSTLGSGGTKESPQAHTRRSFQISLIHLPTSQTAEQWHQSEAGVFFVCLLGRQVYPSFSLVTHANTLFSHVNRAGRTNPPQTAPGTCAKTRLSQYGMILDSVWVRRSKIWVRWVLELFIFYLAAIQISLFLFPMTFGVCMCLNLQHGSEIGSFVLRSAPKLEMPLTAGPLKKTTHRTQDN